MGESGEGPATASYPYGEYVGGRDANLDRHLYGSALLPNGDIYEGNYKHGKRHGRGMYCFRNGARYDGIWRHGLKDGLGTMVYPDASKYVGQWRKDLKHGLGIYYYANEDVYEGRWNKGVRHGLGTYTYSKEKVSIKAVWVNGILEGSGIITYPCNYRYHGTFRRNIPIGPGVFSFENKWIQTGFYINKRDPTFDYVGVANLSPTTEDESMGIVPIWCARNTVKYSEDLLPPEPMDIPTKDSEDSLSDILEYLQKEHGRRPLEMEGDYDHPQVVPAPTPVSSEEYDFYEYPEEIGENIDDLEV